MQVGLALGLRGAAGRAPDTLPRARARVPAHPPRCAQRGRGPRGRGAGTHARPPTKWRKSSIPRPTWTPSWSPGRPPPRWARRPARPRRTTRASGRAATTARRARAASARARARGSAAARGLCARPTFHGAELPGRVPRARPCAYGCDAPRAGSVSRGACVVPRRARIPGLIRVWGSRSRDRGRKDDRDRQYDSRRGGGRHDDDRGGRSAGCARSCRVVRAQLPRRARTCRARCAFPRSDRVGLPPPAWPAGGRPRYTDDYKFESESLGGRSGGGDRVRCVLSWTGP